MAWPLLQPTVGRTKIIIVLSLKSMFSIENKFLRTSLEFGRAGAREAAASLYNARFIDAGAGSSTSKKSNLSVDRTDNPKSIWVKYSITEWGGGTVSN